MTPTIENKFDDNYLIEKSMTLYEYPNQIACENIFRHKLINDEDRKRLREFCKGQYTYPIPVEYIMNIPYGRYKLKNTSMHTSMTMWKKVRSTLYKETEYDIDLKLAHFNIAKYLIKNVNFEYLDQYINNREDIIDLFTINEDSLNSFNKKNNDMLQKKDIVKTLFTTILYGGSLQTILKKYNFCEDDIKCPPIFHCICKDIDNLKKLLLEEYKEKISKIEDAIIHLKTDKLINEEKNKLMADKRIKNFDKYIQQFTKNIIKDCKPNERTLIAYLLQDEERLIIEEAFNFLKIKKIKPTSYNFDGFQVLKTDINNKYNNIDNFINLLNEYISFKYDDTIKFEKKEFVEPLNLTNITFEDEFWNPKEFDFCSENEKFDYFNKHIIKILSMGAFVYKIKTDDESGTTLHRIKSPQFFFGYLMEWFDNFCYSPALPVYLTYGIYPKIKAPDYIYNLWEGFAIEKPKYENIEIDETSYKTILKHFDYISNHNEDIKNYLLNWFAHKVIYPYKKIETCLVFLGKQGTGKTSIAEDLFKAIIGASYIYSTSNIDTIVGTFNGMLQGKLLSVLNECSGKDTMPLMDRLKDIITRKSNTITFKGIDGVQVKDLCDYCFTTNNINPIKETKEERRFQIVYVDNSIKGNKEHFKNLYKEIHNPIAVKSFFDFLLKRKTIVDNFHFENDRITNTKQIEELQELNKDPIEDFMDFFFDEECDERVKGETLYRSNDLYKFYVDYQNKRGYKNHINCPSFIHKFSNYDKYKEHYTKTKKNYGYLFDFKFEKVCLLEKQ